MRVANRDTCACADPRVTIGMTKDEAQMLLAEVKVWTHGPVMRRLVKRLKALVSGEEPETPK